MIYPICLQGNDLPPTLYSIMQSIVNFNNTDTVKISDLWQNARVKIFDFNYPLTQNLSREIFEHNILNHYLMRRINYDTVTLFKIMLENKLNEIMPKYNMLWDSQINWDIFKSGTTTREYTDTTTSANTTNSTATGKNDNTSSSDSNSIVNMTNSDSKSDVPQGQIDDVKNSEYISEYVYTVNDSTSNTNGSSKSLTNTTNTAENISNSTDNKTIKETVTRTADNELDILLKYQSEYINIWNMIYKDLDCLFYGLV